MKKPSIMTLSIPNKLTVKLTLTQEGSIYVISEPTRNVVTQGQTIIEALDRMIALIKSESACKPTNE